MVARMPRAGRRGPEVRVQPWGWGIGRHHWDFDGFGCSVESLEDEEARRGEVQKYDRNHGRYIH